MQSLRGNVCIFTKVIHKNSGQQLDIGYLHTDVLIESLELNGPKLILIYLDPKHFITNTCQIKEFDELEVTYGDALQAGQEFIDTFVILTCRPIVDNLIEINAMAKSAYSMKQISDRARIFT